MKKIFVIILVAAMASILWPLAIPTLLVMLATGAIVAVGGGSSDLALVSLENLKALPSTLVELARDGYEPDGYEPF